MAKREEKSNHSLAVYSEKLRGRDITNYEPILQEMISSHTVLNAMYRYNPTVFYISNLADGKFVYFSQESMRKLFRLDDDGMEKMKQEGVHYMMSLILPSDLPAVVEDLGKLSLEAMKGIPAQQVDKIRFSINYRSSRNDGSVCKVLNQYCFIPDINDGMALFSVGSLTDITDVKSDPKITIKAEYFDELSQRASLINTVSPRDEQALIFSERELEIVKLLAEGLDVERIAAKLFISPYTVKAHKRNIFEKADVRKTAELVNKLSKTGII
jgi:DNA-binding CsgD family transcriptional regulator